jgi:hypothetical protein
MEPLFAYIDPGSGSLLIQAFIAMLVAIPIFFRHQIGRAIRAVRGGDATTAATVDQEDTTPGA